MRTRRSGIANLVGAVFFIIIVVLMVGALVTMFDTFNGAVDSQHTSGQSTLAAQQQAVGVQNLVFGGLTSYDGFEYAANGAVTLTANTEQNPILPISNMNFTGNMDGWTTSHTYSLVTDSAMVQTFPQYITYNNTAPATQPVSFTLNVQNNDPLGQPYQIAKVSLLVDQNWAVPGGPLTCPPTCQPSTFNWGPTYLLPNNPPSVVGNNITWVSSYPGFDLGPGANQAFTWIATIPRTDATFYNTVVVSWVKNNLGPPFGPYVDTAIATTNSTITNQEVSDSGFLGTSTAVITSTAGGVTPSGLQTAYDGNALLTSSTSGPGSVYIDYKPSLNSVPLSDGQQLTGTTSLTTSFTLDGATAANMSLSNCCTLTWASSLDGITAPRNSLILYQAYLTGPPIPLFEGTTTSGTSPTTLMDTSAAWAPGAWVGDYLLYTSGDAVGQYLLITASTLNTITTAPFSPSPALSGGDAFIITALPKGITVELPVGGTSCGASPSPYYYVNPTLYNDFSPSGWVYDHVCFNPSTSTAAWLNSSSGWYQGTYTLNVVVTMTVPGEFPLASGYPPGLSIHFDDIGLALRPLPTTVYGSTTFVIPTGLNANQVQGLEIGINATGASQNTTVYAFVSDNSRFVYNPVLWVQIGSASFSNAGRIDSLSPLPNAAYYVNSTLYSKAGKPEVGDIVVRVNATSSYLLAHTASYSVNLNVFAVIQTINQTRAVVEFQNLGNSPVKLISMVVTGPGVALSTNFASNFYMAPGQTVVVPQDLLWMPGQIYTVTVTTTVGNTFTRSFTAPLS